MLGNVLARNRPATTADLERYSTEWYGQLWQQFAHNGIRYTYPGNGATHLLSEYEACRNPIVALCLAIRGMVLSEASFIWQRWEDSRPGDMFGTTALSILEQPWPGAWSGDLIARLDLDASIYGSSYWHRLGDRLIRLDPNHTIVVTSELTDTRGRPWGRQLEGYAVKTNPVAGDRIRFFTPDEVAHYRPEPDPETEFGGRSWIRDVIPDSSADTQITTYKHSFLTNAATPNLAVTFDSTMNMTPDDLKAFKQAMDQAHQGHTRAFKTLYLSPGADVKTVGANFDELDMKPVQGGGETRIAARSGVGAVIAQLSEGMQGSSLNAGNYVSIRRRTADVLFRPLWRSMCAALTPLVDPPDGGVRLWYSDRDIPFLQEDVKDAADIRKADASTMEALIRGGWSPESIVAAVVNDDMSLLEHSGLMSVQLQPPGTEPEPGDDSE